MTFRGQYDSDLTTDLMMLAQWHYEEEKRDVSTINCQQNKMMFYA